MSLDLVRTVRAGDVLIDATGSRRVATKDGIYFPCPMTFSPEELAELLVSRCGYKPPKKDKARKDG